MPFLIVGSISLIVVVVGAIVWQRNKAKLETCPSCGAKNGGITAGNLKKITVKRNYYSYNGDQYIITYIFKCSNCENTREITERRTIEYSCDIIDTVRSIARENWDISSIFIPHYMIEIEK